MLKKEEKQTIVDGLKEHILNSQAVFLTNLIGVSANDAVKVRRDVRNVDGKIVITRNSLFRRAAAGTPVEKLVKGTKGPIALAFAFKDPPAVAKVLFEVSKEIELIKLRDGILDGKQISSKEVEALAKLPSKNQMLATLLATFNAPVSAFVRVLDAIKTQKEVSN